MKFPFISRSTFDVMLQDKNRQIADLKAEHDLFWRTHERYDEIIRDLHGQVGERNLRISSLEHQLCEVLDFLPEPVFKALLQSVDKTNATSAQNGQPSQRALAKKTPPRQIRRKEKRRNHARQSAGGAKTS